MICGSNRLACVEQIRSDIARLRGQVEVLTYELEQAQKRLAETPGAQFVDVRRAGEYDAGHVDGDLLLRLRWRERLHEFTVAERRGGGASRTSEPAMSGVARFSFASASISSRRLYLARRSDWVIEPILI